MRSCSSYVECVFIEILNGRSPVNLVRKVNVVPSQDQLKTQSICISQEICNSIVHFFVSFNVQIRLSLLKSIVDAYQSSANDEDAAKKAVSAIRIPESVQLSNTHTLTTPSAEIILEEYAHRIITGSVVLILFESNVKSISKEALDFLIQILQQFIGDMGKIAKYSETSIESIAQFNQTHYHFDSFVNSTLSEIAQSIITNYYLPPSTTQKRPNQEGSSHEPKRLQSLEIENVGDTEKCFS